MNFKALKSFIYLGYYFFVHLFQTVFYRGKNRVGLADFYRFYKNDSIFAFSPKERSEYPAFSYCISCRLCDVSCPAFDVNNNLSSPSYAVTGYSRLLTNFSELKQNLPDCGPCQICEDICPENVPIKTVLDFIRKAA